MQQQVQQHIVAGLIPEALAMIEQAAPGTLGNHPRIKFQLQCQQFVEMVSPWDHHCMHCTGKVSGRSGINMPVPVITA